jgi:DNA-binding transcriptional regulator YiaG
MGLRARACNIQSKGIPPLHNRKTRSIHALRRNWRVRERAPIMARQDPVVLRRTLHLNQTDFWNRLGVSQSGGSRYENGFSVPGYLSLLMALAYGKTPLKSLHRLRGRR